MIITEAISNRYWSVRIYFVYSRRIARELMPELRRSVSIKACSKVTSVAERAAYVKCRAVQLAQPLVDSIVRDNPCLPSRLAIRLVLSAATKAAAALSEIERQAKKAKRPKPQEPMWMLSIQSILRVVSAVWKFSSRRVALKSVLTLLIVTTLVAAALGAGVMTGR